MFEFIAVCTTLTSFFFYLIVAGQGIPFNGTLEESDPCRGQINITSDYTYTVNWQITGNISIHDKALFKSRMAKCRAAFSIC